MQSVAMKARLGGREERAIHEARLFSTTLRPRICGEEGLTVLEAFAAKAEAVASHHNQEMQRVLAGDAAALNRHANYMRKVRASIVLLCGGFLPAIRIDPGDEFMRVDALASMAYLHGEFEAMKLHLR